MVKERTLWVQHRDWGVVRLSMAYPETDEARYAHLKMIRGLNPDHEIIVLCRGMPPRTTTVGSLILP